MSEVVPFPPRRDRDREQVVALAGLFQATFLVQSVAHDGACEDSPLETIIASVLKIDSSSALDVYGAPEGLRVGLVKLREQLDSNRSQRNLEQMRYAANLLVLEQRLLKRADLLSQLSEGLAAVAKGVADMPLTHDDVLAQLADIYLSTVSKLKPRVIVNGTPEHLADPHNANRIRALLMAGLRSAVLWRQLGGSRWRLFFGRGRLASIAQAMLAEMDR